MCRGIATNQPVATSWSFPPKKGPLEHEVASSNQIQNYWIHFKCDPIFITSFCLEQSLSDRAIESLGQNSYHFTLTEKETGTL